MKHRITLCAAALAALVGAAPAGAQAPAAKPVAKGAASAPAPTGSAALGIPAGTGPGVHSPDSPITPLAARADVVPWSVLSDLGKKTTKDGILPVFNARQQEMDKTVQRMGGSFALANSSSGGLAAHIKLQAAK